jgi:hypothetical protein
MGRRIRKDLKREAVNHPTHYCVGGVEAIDVIEAWNLNYHLGNVLKYLCRADHKGDRLRDLEKALWYLTREVRRTKRLGAPRGRCADGDGRAGPTY